MKHSNQLTEKVKKSSTCESCGVDFGCGASQNSCWCFDLKLTDEAKDEVAKRFNDCLCPSCLKAFETVNSKN